MITEDADFLRPLVRSVIQEFLEAEMVGGRRCGERRASRGVLELSKRLLSTQLDYPGRQARITLPRVRTLTASQVWPELSFRRNPLENPLPPTQIG